MSPTIFYITLSSIIFCSLALNIPCPLYWEQYNAENFESLNETVVSALGTKSFVARAKGQNGVYAAGYFDISKEAAYIPTSPFEFGEFEVLINKHNCTVLWGSGNSYDDSLFVPVTEGASSPLIAKGNIPFSAFGLTLPINGYRGGVDVGEKRSDGQLHYVKQTQTGSVPTTYRTYLYLVSYSKGFDLFLKDFKFEVDPNVASYRVVNVETIENMADVLVSQVVSHTKTIVKSHSFTTTKTTSSEWSVSASATFTYAGITGSISGGYGEETKDSWSETLSTSKEEKITISKNITVGAFESVVACSAIKWSNDFESQYEATAEYSAPGLSGEQIKDILESVEGFTNISYTAFSASITTHGVFQGSTGISTNFFITPKNAVINCRNLKDFEM